MSSDPPPPSSAPHSEARTSTAQSGENAAAGYLARKGCRIVARNWRANPGEIDIVAECPAGDDELTDSATPTSVLAFVEVRTRHGPTGLAEESISPRKAASMIAAAYSYMAAHDLDADRTPWRIDLVAVTMSGPTIRSINWIQGAVGEEMVREE